MSLAPTIETVIYRNSSEDVLFVTNIINVIPIIGNLVTSPDGEDYEVVDVCIDYEFKEIIAYLASVESSDDE